MWVGSEEGVLIFLKEDSLFWKFGENLQVEAFESFWEEEEVKEPHYYRMVGC